jgi:hypothetical protein
MVLYENELSHFIWNQSFQTESTNLTYSSRSGSRVNAEDAASIERCRESAANASDEIVSELLRNVNNVMSRSR